MNEFVALASRGRKKSVCVCVLGFGVECWEWVWMGIQIQRQQEQRLRLKSWDSLTLASTAILRRVPPLSFRTSPSPSIPAIAAFLSDPMALVPSLSLSLSSHLHHFHLHPRIEALLIFYLFMFVVTRKDHHSQDIRREAHGGAWYGSCARKISFPWHHVNIFRWSLLPWWWG